VVVLSGTALLPRRDLVRALVGLGLAFGCSPSVNSRRPPPASKSAPALRTLQEDLRGPVSLYTWFDLPDDPRSQELSGIAWDDSTRTLWAVQDGSANIVPLHPDRNFARWQLGSPLRLQLSFSVDLEGIVLVPGAFIVANEKGNRLLEVDGGGSLRREIPLPAHFSTARVNKSLEALSLTPDGKHLFTTSEGTLECDGPMPTNTTGGLLRILRMGFPQGDTEEHAYLTDPLPHQQGGDYGVADLVAIAHDEVLVLERGWTPGVGNTARIYHVNLDDEASSCSATPALSASMPVLAKKLLVDLKTLHAHDLPAAEEAQPSPLLDNFEGMALGPRLPDGRSSLILVSDDNSRAEQRARVIVLALG
jgi:hypothetical protein